MMIALERKRQVEVEGWSDSHDDQYICGQLSDFEVCYAPEDIGDMRTETRCMK